MVQLNILTSVKLCIIFMSNHFIVLVLSFMCSLNNDLDEASCGACRP